MKDLAPAILEESEFKDPIRPAFTAERPSIEKIFRTKAILTFKQNENAKSALAFSGGDDSLVLLDLAYHARVTPMVTWTDTRMEYPETREFIERTVNRYGLELRIARPFREPLEQWQAVGWPFLGKLAARLWTQNNKNAGFTLNVSECCRTMKIIPGRRLVRNLGCSVQFTGQRGQTDDSLRGMRSLKDGYAFYNVRDKIWIVNPLLNWTDAEIAGYIENRGLERHPAKACGARTIGCVFCGGGCQYTNSGIRVLRKTWPQAWLEYIITWGAGRIILALKYQVGLEAIDQALEKIGGLTELAEKRPWVFDFTRQTPIPGYRK